MVVVGGEGGWGARAIGEGGPGGLGEGKGRGRAGAGAGGGNDHAIGARSMPIARERRARVWGEQYIDCFIGGHCQALGARSTPFASASACARCGAAYEGMHQFYLDLDDSADMNSFSFVVLMCYHAKKCVINLFKLKRSSMDLLSCYGEAG